MPKNKNEAKKVDHTRAHLEQLVGSKILSITEDGEGWYGLVLERPIKSAAPSRHIIGSEIVVAWISRDPEGNGPGWLQIEED